MEFPRQHMGVTTLPAFYHLNRSHVLVKDGVAKEIIDRIIDTINFLKTFSSISCNVDNTRGKVTVTTPSLLLVIQLFSIVEGIVIESQPVAGDRWEHYSLSRLLLSTALRQS